MRKIGAMLGAALTIAATPAMARWHGTEWGMTKTQVRAAIKAPLAAGDKDTTFIITGADDSSRDVLKGRITVLGQPMDAVFAFDPKGRLFAIELYVVDAKSCAPLLLRLQRLYGSRGGFGYMAGDPDGRTKWYDWTDPAQSIRAHFLGSGWTPPPAASPVGTPGMYEGCSVALSKTKPEPSPDW